MFPASNLNELFSVVNTSLTTFCVALIKPAATAQEALDF